MTGTGGGGIIIAGTHSGCGKTTVTLGVLAALRKKGLAVQPFKAGPDFIDSGLHRLVSDRPSRNLDQWMCGPDFVADCFARHAAGADIAVIEGVMGMYDGDCSTAGLAALLRVPVILVVDASGMAESAGAVVKGFVDFGFRIADCGMGNGTSKSKIPNPKSGIEFAGVIFNRVASEHHYKRLKDSVQNVPVLGYLPRETDFEIPHRHLGLSIAEENPLAGENIERLADTVLRYIDVEELIRYAGCRVSSPPLQEPALSLPKGEGKGGDGSAGVATGRRMLTRPHPSPLPPMNTSGAGSEGEGGKARKIRIAVAYDKAFSFYYEDNLDMLRDAGAEIIRFSPLVDPVLPAGADAVYIGGGYPELHAEALSRNVSLLGSVRAWAGDGKPLYAECGGLMYLSKGIRDFDNRFFAMAGVFPFVTKMTKKPRLGYRNILLNEDCVIGNKDEKCRGHEFHYSEIDTGTLTRDREEQKTIYRVSDKSGGHVRDEGFRFKNTLASYVHVHFGSNPQIAERFASFVKGDRNA